jgi:hypothetical protein
MIDRLAGTTVQKNTLALMTRGLMTHEDSASFLLGITLNLQDPS